MFSNFKYITTYETDESAQEIADRLISYIRTPSVTATIRSDLGRFGFSWHSQIEDIEYPPIQKYSPTNMDSTWTPHPQNAGNLFWRKVSTLIADEIGAHVHTTTENSVTPVHKYPLLAHDVPVNMVIATFPFVDGVVPSRNANNKKKIFSDIPNDFISVDRSCNSIALSIISAVHHPVVRQEIQNGLLCYGKVCVGINIAACTNERTIMMISYIESVLAYFMGVKITMKSGSAQIWFEVLPENVVNPSHEEDL